MKIRLAVPAIMIFTFALATNIKKTPRVRKTRTGGLIPPCADKDVVYEGDVISVVPSVRSAGECGNVCFASTKCQYWSFYEPRPDSPPTKYRAYDCITKSSKLEGKPHVGFHSGVRGCKSGDRSDGLPTCADKDAFFEGDVVNVHHKVGTARLCGRICVQSDKCRYWSYYQPGIDSDPTSYQAYDCITKSTFFGRSNHKGFHSGKRGCQ